jgi:predicted O-methyltransferase YrrM
MAPELRFHELVWLFQCDSRNRGIIRQGFDEAALLWKAAKATSGDILEIGRNQGGSTALLAAASIDRAVYSIDIRDRTHPAVRDFLERPQINGRVHLLLADSRQALPGRIFGLVFIDGDHSFEGVLADTIAHWNALRTAGTFPALAAFHDAVPNENFRWRDSHRKVHRLLTRVKNLLRKERKSEITRDYEEGVYRVCHKLIELSCAEPWVPAAGSMFVLKKLRDLPKDFAERFGRADATAAAQAAFGQYSRVSR